MAVSEIEQQHAAAAPAAPRGFWLQAAIFALVGLVLYGILVVIAEQRVRATSERNPLFQVAMADSSSVDVVVLGASHAMPLGFEGIDSALEEASGRSVMTLAAEGSGLVPNAFLLDALHKKARPKTLVYSIDSFTFLSSQWNEERLNDTELFARAPYDLDILNTLIAEPAAWKALPGYLSGFHKVNRLLSSEVDRTEAELVKFGRTYRPNERIDYQRIAYLFPETPKERMDQYLREIEDIVESTTKAGSEMILLLIPAPARYTDRLPPVHKEVMAAVTEIAARHGARLVDHTSLLPEDANYYDTDHLNRRGATAYVTGPLAEVLRGS